MEYLVGLNAAPYKGPNLSHCNFLVVQQEQDQSSTQIVHADMATGTWPKKKEVMTAETKK
jgi:hypothetical protein